MNQQRGNILFNTLLVVLCAVIAVLIYMLAGGPMPGEKKSVGVASPQMDISDSGADISTNDTYAGEFSDGLGVPDSAQEFALDEFGAGISERDVFNRDINNDGRIDRITRTRNENGTVHFFYEYVIELNTGNGFVDITPDGFRTTEGADCALQKLKFIFQPDFRVIKISRKWQETWDTPTMAQRTEYTLNNNQLVPENTIDMRTVCDVSELFYQE